MQSLPSSATAATIGASGGIGASLLAALQLDPAFTTIHALGRAFEDAPGQDRVRHHRLDLTDEASIEVAAGRIAGPVHLLIVATGTLRPAGHAPEKTYRAMDPVALLEAFRINTIGPALIAKHMLPLLPSQGRGIFAALSARVGSIGDNRAGGWHAYRASKAALNMIIRNLAIETARRNNETICVGLHPGTVDTGLSRPFQRGVPEGKLFTPDYAATRLLDVIDGLTAEDSGKVLAWDGAVVPP